MCVYIKYMNCTTVPTRDPCPVGSRELQIVAHTGVSKKGALIQTSNCRALITRTPTKRTPIYRNCHMVYSMTYSVCVYRNYKRIFLLFRYACKIHTRHMCIHIYTYTVFVRDQPLASSWPQLAAWLRKFTSWARSSMRFSVGSEFTASPMGTDGSLSGSFHTYGVL